MAENKYGSFSQFQEANQEKAVTEAGVREFIRGKAAEDEGFRKALVADALGTVESEIGVKMPSRLKLVVHEESNEELHLVLPAPLELTPQQLQVVSGGWPPTTNPGTFTSDDAFYDADGGNDYD